MLLYNMIPNLPSISIIKDFSAIISRFTDMRLTPWLNSAASEIRQEKTRRQK